MSEAISCDLENSELIAKIHTEANLAIEQRFRGLLERREGQDGRIQEQRTFTDSLIRTVLGADTPRKIAPSLDVKEVLKAMRERGEAHSAIACSPAAKAFALRPLSNVRDGVLDADIQLVGVNADAKLDILVPPYANQFVSVEKSGDGDAHAFANHADGTFNFIHGTGDGSATSAAGVWVQFEPSLPLPRFIQVRPYVEFAYQYDDLSSYGYTAHNLGSFGIFVVSFDMRGNDRRIVQDYRYAEPVWSDGTGWWENHSNPDWDNSDFDFAFIYGKQAPYFRADPGRIYMACIWCFGSCDAASGFFGHAVAVGDIRARVGFVVIGQQ